MVLQPSSTWPSSRSPLCYPGLAEGPANTSIQNRLSRLLESFSFLPISDPTARFRRALRNKRFSAACDPTRTEVDERGSALEPWQTRKRTLDDPDGAR